MSDTIMVYSDLPAKSLDLLLCLLEKEMDSHDTPNEGILDNGIEVFTAEEVTETWELLKAAEDRMDTKLAKLGIAVIEPKEEVIDLRLGGGGFCDLWEDFD